MTRLRFGIRTLLVLTTVVAVCFGAYQAHIARQRAAVAELRRLGATVHYEVISKPSKLFGWLRRVLGEDSFRSVDQIASLTNATDETLSLMDSLRSTKSVDIWSGTITEAGFAQLAMLSQLESLNFGQVSGVTDEGLRKLTVLPNLKVLVVPDTLVTDESIKVIGTLPRIQCVDLSGCKITDAGLEPLRNSATIEILLLSNTELTDEAASVLSSIRHLRRLDLEGCRITDKGLAELEALSDLGELHIRHSSVTLKGVERFQFARPLVAVDYDAPVL